MQDVLRELFSSTLAVFGGAALVIGGLSALLGKIWSGRIVERERAQFQRIIEIEKIHAARDLEFLRAEMQSARDRSNRVHDARFELYSSVWAKLQSLREEGERLWHDASPDNAERFGVALMEARSAINRGRLILRESDYQELQGILRSFGEYEVGKKSLIDMRSREELRANASGLNRTRIQEQIERNHRKRGEYEELLGRLVHHFRHEIGTAA